jgi:hypothetical protein
LPSSSPAPLIVTVSQPYTLSLSTIQPHQAKAKRTVWISVFLALLL